MLEHCSVMLSVSSLGKYVEYLHRALLWCVATMGGYTDLVTHCSCSAAGAAVWLLVPCSWDQCTWQPGSCSTARGPAGPATRVSPQFAHFLQLPTVQWLGKLFICHIANVRLCSAKWCVLANMNTIG